MGVGQRNAARARLPWLPPAFAASEQNVPVGRRGAGGLVAGVSVVGRRGGQSQVQRACDGSKQEAPIAWFCCAAVVLLAAASRPVGHPLIF